MGGIGSGSNKQPGSKELTEDRLSIDIRVWYKQGLLTHNQSFVWEWSDQEERLGSISVATRSYSITLSYRYTHNGIVTDQKIDIRLDRTPCNYGGSRPWFLCPGCGRRSAVLYSGPVFACRCCHKLAYPSQRETPEGRAERRAEALRDRLGREGGDECNKPKGMHWSTYHRITDQYDQLISIANSAAERYIMDLISKYY